MTVSILMPVGGPDDAWRTRARTWVLEHYRSNHDDWELIQGHCAEPWSKGAAVADAYRRSTGDIIVLADADSFVEPDALRECVTLCESGIGWAVPHRIVYRLTEDETERVYTGHPPRIEKVVRFPYTGPAGGGVTVLPRSSYEAVNGLDERFYGWGGEDVSFAIALYTIVGWHARLASPLIHLWHPHPAPDLRGSSESEALVARYKAAREDIPAMTALVEEHDGPRKAHDADRHRLPCH